MAVKISNGTLDKILSDSTTQAMWRVTWGLYDWTCPPVLFRFPSGYEEFDCYDAAYEKYCDCFHCELDFFILAKRTKDNESGEYYWRTIKCWDSIEHLP